MIIAKTKDGQDITKYNLEQFLNKNPNLEITLNPFLEAYFMSDIINLCGLDKFIISF